MSSPSQITASSKILNAGTLDTGQLSDFVLMQLSVKIVPISLYSEVVQGLKIQLHQLLIGGHTMARQHYSALRGLWLATEIYEKLEGGTIPLSILSNSLGSGLWIPPNPWSIGGILDFDGKIFSEAVHTEFSEHNDFDTETSSISEASETSDEDGLEVTRAQTLSCIAMFEAGINVHPDGLQHVIAMAWENSIFVTNLLLSDPSDVASAHSIKRITGNVGRPGLTMMVAPNKPQIRAPSNSYRLVNHVDYDGKREDNFKNTSLHLSFTEWNVPLVSSSTGDRGAIDQDVFFLESVVSVHDQGTWVADLDVLKLLKDVTQNNRSYDIATEICDCSEKNPIEQKVGLQKKVPASIDTWDELLDPPESIAIFRAKDNWWPA